MIIVVKACFPDASQFFHAEIELILTCFSNENRAFEQWQKFYAHEQASTYQMLGAIRAKAGQILQALLNQMKPSIPLQI